MSASKYTGPIYSYVRFSAKKQHEGDSVRRQKDAALKWCKDRGLTLDKTLRADRGIPAYRGQNLDRGNLGKFIAMVRAGVVPPGSTLLIENLDRLSRQAINGSFSTFWTLIHDLEIRVVTLMDGEEYTRDNINEEKLNRCIGALRRAHEESKTKGERIKETFAEIRKNLGDKKWPTSYPPWLELSTDGKKFSVIKEKARVIRRLFTEYDRGLGVFTIARRLTAEKVGRPSDGRPEWPTSTVQHYLTSRSVIGEFQPRLRTEAGREPVGTPIPNYYPAIIDRRMFARVASRVRKSPRVSGRHSPDLVNVFRGLLRCPYCGSNILLKRQIKVKGRRNDTYVCDRAHRHQTCLAFGWERQDLESCFLELGAKVQSEYATVRRAKPAPSAMPTIIAEIAEAGAEEDRILSLFRKGIINEAKLRMVAANIQKRLAELRLRKEALENSTSARAEKQLKLDLTTLLSVDLKDNAKRDLLAGVIQRMFWRIDLYFTGLPSRQQWLVEQRDKLRSRGLKGNQIFFKLGREADFLAERFFVAYPHEMDARPHPDFLTDPDFTGLFPPGAAKEFKSIIAKAKKERPPQ